MILNLLDTFEVLFKEGLWFFFGLKLRVPETGLPPLPRLHMAIHGFVLKKYTKPVDEHHLQAPAVTSQTSFSIT